MSDQDDVWSLPKPTPHYAVAGTLREDGCDVVEVSYSVMSPRIALYGARATLEVLAADGSPLASSEVETETYRAYMMPRDDEPHAPVECHTRFTEGFHGYVQALPEGKQIRLRRDGQTLWSRSISDRAPQILSFSCEIDGQVGRLRWSEEVAVDEYYEAQLWVEQAGRRCVTFGNDPGTSYTDETGRRRGMTRGGCDFDLFHLPVGQVDLTLHICDGFHEAAANVRVFVPSRPMRVRADGQVRDDGRFLAGAILHSRENEWATADSFTWRLDGVEVGQGQMILLDGPPPPGSELLVYASHGGEVVHSTVEVRTI